MTITDTNIGIRLGDLYYLKFYITVMRVGKNVYDEVFGWAYVGGSSPFKEVLFGLNGYNIARYCNDFDERQREKIDEGVPMSELDITLLYKLFQMVCGLKDPSDPDWVTEDSDSLEYCLYALKKTRNAVAHDIMKFGQEDLEARLEDLRKLYVRMLKKAGERFGVDEAQVTALQDSVHNQIDAILDSAIPTATTSEYEEERRDNKRVRLLEE